MSWSLPLLTCLPPLLAAPLSARAGSMARARGIAIAGMLASLAVAVAPVLVGGALPTGLPFAEASVPRGLPFFVAAIGLVAVSLTTAHDARPMTLARILSVSGVSLAFVAATHPLWLALLWSASAGIVWSELHGSERSRPTARVFAFYHLPGSVLLLLGAALWSSGRPSAAVLAVGLGIAIREATVPFHSWLPHMVERAPLGLVAVFVAPQLGVYAHLRLLAGHLSPELTAVVAAVGVVTVLFAALLGAAQQNARRALGYLMMSQSGLVAFGLETGSGLGHVGAMTMWMVCGLAMAGLAMTVSALEARRGPLRIDRPGGSFRHVPHLATAFLVLGLASVGLPGTLGFVAEDLLVQGSVERFPALGLALIVGTALNSATVMRCFFALFTGRRTRAGEQDLRARERLALALVVAVLVGAGVAPSLLLGRDADAAGAPHAAALTEEHGGRP